MIKLALKVSRILFLFHLAIFPFFSNSQKSFLATQKTYERVRTSISEKEGLIAKKLKENNLQLANLNILIIVYKSEDILEIYTKKKTEKVYNKLVEYEICSKSGSLGPKRKQGDNQVPEGFYYIDRFNPNSNFYLSLGLNYPNESDKLKSKATDLGGDIFIHGQCVTIGCMPMTDEKIKEIYLYAINAKNNGQTKIPVYIFPFKMTNKNFYSNKEKYKNESALLDFWTNLKEGYEKFHQTNIELKTKIDSKGIYTF